MLQYTIFNEMTNVISCEVVNSDMFFEDDDVSVHLQLYLERVLNGRILGRQRYLAIRR